MARIKVSETINAPVATVFGYVDDYRNTTRYMKDLVKWEPIGSMTHGKGSRFAVGMKTGPIDIESEVEINTWAENSAIGWVTTKGFRQDGTWSFRERDGGTEASLEVTFDVPGGIAGRMMSKAIEPVLKGTLGTSVRQLKEETEKLATKG